MTVAPKDKPAAAKEDATANAEAAVTELASKRAAKPQPTFAELQAKAREARETLIGGKQAKLDALVGIPFVFGGTKIRRDRFQAPTVTTWTLTEDGSRTKHELTGMLAEKFVRKYTIDGQIPEFCDAPYGLFTREFTSQDGQRMLAYDIASKPVNRDGE